MTVRKIGVTAFVCIATAAAATELKTETANAWDAYVKDLNKRMELRLAKDGQFLWTDEDPARIGKIQSGEILAGPATETVPRHVPSGLIHDWIGAAFIKDAKIDDALAVLRDYGRYRDFYEPHVISAKGLRQEKHEDMFNVVLVNKAVLLRTAIDSDYRTRYFRVDAKRMYGISESTRIQEIENLGLATQRELPPDQGSGFLWRLYSVSRFEERDGGLVMEVEAVALSRDIPFAFRLFVDPIVKRVSRNSLLTSLKQTQEAVANSAAPVPTGQ